MLHAADTAARQTELTVAFQPLLHAATELPFAWAAVARGMDGATFEGLSVGLGLDDRLTLDCRRAALAVRRAVAAGFVQSGALLFVPVSAACPVPDRVLAELLAAAQAHGLPADRILVEVNADERGSLEAAERLAEACAIEGLAIALGAYTGGHVGLNLLTRFKPRFVRLGRSLVRNVDCSDSRRVIVESTLRLARSLDSTLVAPAAETEGELRELRRIGIAHIQRGAAPRPLPSAVAPRRGPRTIPLGTQRDASAHRRLPPVESAVALFA